MNSEKLKKLSIQVMIGGLLGAALIAVVAVLAGSFNSVFIRALFTLLFVMLHALACLSFIGQAAKKSNNFRFFENSVFFLVVLSFFTSIFGVWGFLPGEIIARLYGTYGILLFACLHGQMLSETKGKKIGIDLIVNSNYVLMFIVVILAMPVLWLDSGSFPGFYYRILAAFGIIDATLTILAVIIHRMYIQKHPETQSTIFSVATQLDANGVPVKVQTVTQKRRIHPLIWLLGIFIVGQMVISLLFGILGAFYRH